MYKIITALEHNLYVAMWQQLIANTKLKNTVCNNTDFSVRTFNIAFSHLYFFTLRIFPSTSFSLGLPQQIEDYVF